MAEFVLHVKDIDDAGKDYAFKVEKGWLGEALEGSPLSVDPDAGDGTFTLHAQKDGADIFIDGRLQTDVVTECCRCLGDMPLPVDVRVVTLFTARGPQLRPEPDEMDLTPEELDRAFYSGNELVLDAMVREHVLLELPMKPLCSDACEGIPVPRHVQPPPGVFEPSADDVDPRLAPLKDIAAQLKE